MALRICELAYRKSDRDSAEAVITALPADGQTWLEQLVERYRNVPPSTQGEKAKIWYCFRRLIGDWREIYRAACSFRIGAEESGKSWTA